MNLSDFTSIFELCVAFNFLYAAFENFSKNIQLFFSRPFNEYAQKPLTDFSKKVQQIKDHGILQIPNINAAKITSKLDEGFIELDLKIKKLASPNRWDLEYKSKFKGVYLLTGFYSFFLLLLSGSDHYFLANELYHSLFNLNLILTIIFLLVFVSTFTNSNIRIRPLYSLLIFLILILIFFISYYSLRASKLEKFIPAKDCTVAFSLTTVIIPFTLHFLRVMIEIVIIRIIIFRLSMQFERHLFKADNEVNRLEYAYSVIKQYESGNENSEKLTNTNPTQPED